MKTEITLQFEIDTEANVTVEHLRDDFLGYMFETIGLPYGNVFSHDTGEDLGEITVTSLEVKR